MKIVLKTLFAIALLLGGTIGSAWAADVMLYVTRHGKTMFNTVERAQGWSDTPLTPAGVAVAEQLGRGLQPLTFIAAWSSDAGRARETAQLVMKTWKNPPLLQEKKGLREVCFGLYEGDLNKNMITAAAHQAGYSSDAALMEAYSAGKIDIAGIIDAIKRAEASGSPALEGMKSTVQAESAQQVAKRMVESMTDIARQAQQQGGGNVLVVSHGLAISSLLQALGDKGSNQPLKNASVSLLRYTDSGRFVIESVNDMRYVERGL
ncbi:histidine phosphatase family protein [Pantoea sp. ACRSH]|uniref:histidine phosphatase family protein n=1 Tax=unclassified Pantoea TaxID=2630326 RepID=UPI001EF525D0|nr:MULTISPECIES: histidine phosphatase family protein [unclassified Pantoea]MCG7365241.1 histidine phosphatase family protein [Pantoea sp. ACRSH]MCG7395807.1 histidine phosphatase family protein [Pantoea sp. ACRSC]